MTDRELNELADSLLAQSAQNKSRPAPSAMDIAEANAKAARDDAPAPIAGEMTDDQIRRFGQLWGNAFRTN